MSNILRFPSERIDYAEKSTSGDVVALRQTFKVTFGERVMAEEDANWLRSFGLASEEELIFD